MLSLKELEFSLLPQLGNTHMAELKHLEGLTSLKFSGIYGLTVLDVDSFAVMNNLRVFQAYMCSLEVVDGGLFSSKMKNVEDM